jgi:adenine-specific DNA methylase
MPTAFPSTPAPTAEKLRGGYYTPPSLATFLAAYVSDAGPKLLEPSCGDGAILRFLRETASVTAVELDEVEAAKASSAVPAATVIEDDFFRWLDPTERGVWDGVAGNPPFIRYQHWTEPTRSIAFDLMRSVSMKPTKLTNAWVPFVVGASLALREGGRLALVVPAELLQVSYASELRAFLIDEFAELTVLTFRRLLFDRVLQEVVLLLGVRGPGPARIRVVECDDADSLPTADTLTAWPQAPALRHETEKWTKYFLPSDEIAALRTVRDGLPGMTRLGAIADVDVGVVTGRNQFFVLRPSDTNERDLGGHILPLVSKSAHIAGIRFGASDLATLEEADALCQLLAVDASLALADDAALQTYVEEGEDAGVHLGYKCRIRKQWWSVPSIWRPDAFMLRQIYDHPRIIANDTGATSTDTIHRVRMVNGTQPGALAAASINSVTFAFSEVLGRSYGGGVLELEPREAEALPYPEPDGLSARDVKRVDALLRAGKLLDALDYVDQRLLVARAGMDPDLIATLRGAWQRLRDRRLARGRTATASATGAD